MCTYLYTLIYKNRFMRFKILGRPTGTGHKNCNTVNKNIRKFICGYFNIEYI